MRKQKLKYSKNMERDTILCVTDNNHAGMKAANLLIDKSIAFKKREQWIPPHARDRYNGASQIWVISVNQNNYSLARHALAELDARSRSRVRIRRYS